MVEVQKWPPIIGVVFILFGHAVMARDVDKIDVGQFTFSIATGYWRQDNPLVDAGDRISYVVPQWSYYGEKWFVDNLTLGFAFNESDHQRFAWIATPETESEYFYFADDQTIVHLNPREEESTAQRASPMHEHPFSYAVGVEYTYFGDVWQWSTNMLGSTTHGLDAFISHWQALRDWRWGALQLQTSVLARYASSQYVDRYYAAVDYNTTPPAIYHGRASWSFAAGVDVDYALDDQWSWQLQYHRHFLGDGISDSPLVKQKIVEQYFVGFLFSYP